MKKTFLVPALVAFTLGAANAQDRPSFVLTDVIPMEYMGLSPAVRDLPPEMLGDARPGKPVDREDREHEREARKHLHKPVNPNALLNGADPALQTAAPLYSHGHALDLSVTGEGNTGVNPADPCLAVGPNHVIQMINNSSSSYFRICDKSLNTILLSGQPHKLLSAVTGVAGAGDPVVLYDALADRWLMTEFGASGNRFLIAVSQTADPTGAYYIYNFTTSQFPDYPKYGVWNNTYVITSNESSPAIYCLPRANMLTGAAGTTVRFTVTAYGTIGFQACTPVNFSGGTPPPAGALPMFMRMADNAWGAPVDRLELWNINYNAATPASSTISAANPANLATVDFDSGMCGYTSFSCVDQPGNANYLDPLREVLMNRVQYRNIGGYEAIVCNHVTDVGSDVAGVRWYELHRTGGIANPWGIYQQGTWSPAPSGVHRWMAGIAINNNGDIGLAYNVASSSIFTSIRYTGRYASDPLGQMTFAETSIIAGTANNNSNRWGDYNSLDVDPADGLSFYGTACYNPSASWNTRMFKFSFPSISLSVGVKAKLEGPYDSGTGLMHDSLRVRGLLPLSEPYTAMGYTFVGGGGEATAAPVLAVSGSNAIVDWVIVELRSAANNTTVVASKAGLLQRDGDIVGVDGTTALTFSQPSASYYVAVRHRNHLGMITNATVALSGSVVTVDLTAAATVAYGTEPRKDISGTQVMWEGNTFKDSPVNVLYYTGANNDRDPILLAIGGIIPTNTISGYTVNDVNMDGTVKYTGAGNDRDPILSNIGGVIPTNSRQEQLP